MSKVMLNIREGDRIIFDMIKSGEKSIETRAGTVKFRNVAVGDTLVIKCGKDRFEKEVVDIYTFKSIEELLDTLDLKEIMPQVKSVSEAEKIWYSFSGYKEKIEKYGLVAFRLKQ